jgi:hypothetical protein
MHFITRLFVIRHNIMQNIPDVCWNGCLAATLQPKKHEDELH